MTTCIAPSEIQAGNLLAVVEGAAALSVTQHVQRCATCAATVRQLARAHTALQAAADRADCPPTERLLLYQAGQLSPRDRKAVAAHMAECAACTREVQQLAALDAPQHDLQADLTQVLHTLREWREALRWPLPAHLAAAWRSRGFGPTLYQSGDVHIVVGVELLPGVEARYELRGRVTRDGAGVADAAGRLVRLVRDQALIAQAALDELGYFAFETLSAGQYAIWLDWIDHDIALHAVMIGVPRQSDGDDHSH